MIIRQIMNRKYLLVNFAHRLEFRHREKLSKFATTFNQFKFKFKIQLTPIQYFGFTVYHTPGCVAKGLQKIEKRRNLDWIEQYIVFWLSGALTYNITKNLNIHVDGRG